ncbi:hypothetical protein D3Z60_04145 [Lachnospiraceae bacterium]|jgi:hypothetical protein|nr:hypothetical protein [Lachnospiraceae bacterium]
MSVAGFGPTQIAKKLKADKVITPTEYWHSIGKPYRRLSTVPYRWSAGTVGNIFSRQEYIGDTVNFHTTSKSFKNKKRLERPQGEWQIFKDTHPAIIDEDTFLLVQELREHRRRPARHGTISIFSGLLYCADCGEKLYYNAMDSKRQHPLFFLFQLPKKF